MPTRFGLQGMRERAARIVGKLRVVSSAAPAPRLSLLFPAVSSIARQFPTGGGCPPKSNRS
jgi:nitrate/nitrite-specific signal transduction histidine kinase